MQHCFMNYKTQLTDPDLYEIWDRLVDAGVAETTFYGAQAVDHHSFRDLVRAPWNDVFLLSYDGVPASVAWLNDRKASSAHIHFTFFHRFRWKKGQIPPHVQIGRYFTARCVRDLPLDVLIGTTPVRNKLACKYIQRVGAKPVGIIPHAAWFADTQQSEDAVISYITRDTTEEEWTRY